MNSDSKMKEVLFDLVDDALYVANGGHLFTRKGVIGICASHLSEKIGGDVDNYKCEKKELIYKIRQCEIDTYDINPNRLTSDSRGEKENRDDYQGRFVWELLQNAADAMGSNLIGSKGLGFKSVLEITEEPEIHSNPFHFKFSSDQTKGLLKEKGISDDPPRLTFRIPHNCLPNDKVSELLDAGYSTVIRLPFRDEVVRKKTKDVLGALEPYFLLLSQQLESIRIILDGDERCLRIERETQGFSDGKVVLYTPEGRADWQRWVVTEDSAEAKRLTVAIALPVDESGKAVPCTDALPFHVFFPTEEQLSVKALLHASFDLQQNRKHLREGNYDTELLDLFGTVLEKVVLDIPAQTALETFGSIPEEGGSGPLERIRKTIREKMRSTRFVPVIGGGKVPPRESQLWKDNLGSVLRADEQKVKETSLVVPELSGSSDILEELGATEIEGDEYVWLLRYCRNESLEDCIASFQILMEGGLRYIHKQSDLLRAIPCWWTEDGHPRPLAEKSPLLWNKPKKWPDWLTVDSLHPKFREKIKAWEKRQKEEGALKDYEWKKLTRGFLSRSPEHYIEWVLIPFVKKWGPQDWEHQGFSVLKFLELWESRHEFDQTEPCIKGEEDRNTLSTVLRLPTGKGWLPAIDCFAGKDWDGPEAFDEFFKEREEVGIVQAFEKWPDDLREIDKNKWMGLLRWAGVSWEPKVCQTPGFTIDQYPPPSLWDEYSRGKDYNFRRDTEGKNYFIRYFQECVSNIERNELIRILFPTLFKLVEGKNAVYFVRRNKSSVHPDSFAWFQLCNEAWLPVKKSILEDRPRIPPNEAFLPNKGLSGLLPEVDRSGIDDNTWHGQDGIESKLRDLGVMDSLPSAAEKWHEWMRRLAEKGDNLSEEAPADWKDRGAGDIWRASRSLYGEYLKREISDSFPDDIKIPCVCLENGRRTLHFSLPHPHEVYWIDEPHLADSTLEKELLEQGYKLFIFRLKDGDKSGALGVRKLSDAIECQPRFDDFNHTESEELLSQRYEKRRIALEKVKKIKLPEAVDIKAVTNLSLELSANEQALGHCSVLSWKEEGTNLILVNIESEKKKWRALADALARRLHDDEEYAKHTNDFEVYLADDEDKSVLERVRNAGVPEEALEEVENSFQQSMPNEQSEEETESESKDFPLEYNHTPPAAPSASDLAHQSSEDAEDTEQQTTNYAGYEARQPTSINGGEITKNTDKSELEASPNVPRPNSGSDQSRADRQQLNGETRFDNLRPESGLEAERWLEERLREQWSNEVEKVHVGRDFTLSVGGRRVHIEAKHVENPPGAIHWSGKQYERAEETSHKKEDAYLYFIAVLSPDRDSENEYSVHWIWDPLERMKDMDRNVTWSGESEPKQLQTGDWNVDDLKPRSVPSKNFSIKVKLTDDVFNEENRDGPQLEKLRARIESLNGVVEQETAGTQLG